MKKKQTPEQQIARLLQSLGCDLKDPNYVDTPKRVAEMLHEEFAPQTLGVATFPSHYSSMVILDGHVTFTRCPHHLERVELVCTIAYLPDGQLLGLSKLARVADYFARGARLQEEFTDLVADFLMGLLKPKGVAVIVRGTHNCMRARGVKTRAHVITSALRGLFLEQHVKQEFFNLIGGRHDG